MCACSGKESDSAEKSKNVSVEVIQSHVSLFVGVYLVITQILLFVRPLHCEYKRDLLNYYSFSRFYKHFGGDSIQNSTGGSLFKSHSLIHDELFILRGTAKNIHTKSFQALGFTLKA